MTDIDLESIANDISKSSKKINNLLRNIDSQRRPILLSALMICMYQKNSVLDFGNSYKHLQPQTIITNIPATLKQVLTDEGVDNNNINILLGEVTFITTDQDLVHTDLLKRILMAQEDFMNYTENGNILTVDSATIGICFYQETKFSASNHVEKLIPKFQMNKYIALFIQTLINKEQFRYGYGRKFSQTRLKKSKIKLPVDSENKPDWEFIENYIKSLPYSGNLLYKSQLSDQK